MNVGALEAGLPAEPSDEVKARLAKFWPRHSESLWKALETRARDRADGLGKALAERAEKEARDMATILTELKRSIEAELRHEPEFIQLELFSDLERDQILRNRESLEARVRQIPEEIETETAQIRARFAEPTPRLFPVAVTYLVPEKHAKLD